MNRKERRAITNPFSETRWKYSTYVGHRPFVGIDAELYSAVKESVNHLRNSFRLEKLDHFDFNWLDSEIAPHRC